MGKTLGGRVSMTPLRRVAPLAMALCAIAAPHAWAATSAPGGPSADPFYCPLHTGAKAAAQSAVLRAASSMTRAQSAYARPPQPKWVTREEFRDPPVVRSANGVLNVRLNVVRKQVRLAGRTLTATTYNGTYAGPTLRVKLGDTINVTLVNLAGKLTNQPTNLHFHGLHVSPNVPHDNIFVHVAPGHSRKYSVTLGKGNFPGTYWYHSHMHGFSEAQLVNGMSGVIIVEGQRKLLPKAFRHIKERVLSLKTAQVNDGDISAGKYSVWAEADSPPADAKTLVPPNLRLVGDQLQPKIRIRPGEVQLWHIANTGANVLYKVQLEKSLFTVIGQDANALDKPQRVKQLFMGGGQRFDVLVTGPPRGVHMLRTIGFTPDNGIVAPTRVLASVVSSGKPMKPPPMPKQGILPFHRLDNARIAARRTFTFGTNGIFEEHRLSEVHDQRRGVRRGPHRRACEARHRRGVDAHQRDRRSPLPHAPERLPGHEHQRQAVQGAQPGGHLRAAATTQRRPAHPDGGARPVREVHRKVRLPLPHPRPRGSGDDEDDPRLQVTRSAPIGRRPPRAVVVVQDGPDGRLGRDGHRLPAQPRSASPPVLRFPAQSAEGRPSGPFWMQAPCPSQADVTGVSSAVTCVSFRTDVMTARDTRLKAARVVCAEQLPTPHDDHL